MMLHLFVSAPNSRIVLKVDMGVLEYSESSRRAYPSSDEFISSNCSMVYGLCIRVLVFRLEIITIG